MRELLPVVNCLDKGIHEIGDNLFHAFAHAVNDVLPCEAASICFRQFSGNVGNKFCSVSLTVNLSETIKHSFRKRFRGCCCGTIKRSHIVVGSIRDCFIDRTAVGSSDKRGHAAAGSKSEKHVAAHHSGLNCQIDKKFTGSRATGFRALDAHGAFLYEFLTAFDNGIDFVILAAAVFSSLIEKRSLHFIVGGKLFRVHA